jgi:beta propeller repeat protein
MKEIPDSVSSLANYLHQALLELNRN